jgi:hypothetical protein
VKTIPWRRVLLAILGVALLSAVAAAALPDNEYQRYSSLEKTIHNRLRWIYERIHYDPAPIDIAIIGPSRSGAAVSAPELEARLAAAGRPLHVVNFSLPENGRDLHRVIAEELLSARAPELLVIAVIEKPGRYGHSAYKYVAPAASVANPDHFGNLNYLSNLIYLPYRQLRLFAARAFPAAFDIPPAFDPARYAGTQFDSTVSFTTGDGIYVERDSRVPRAELEAGVERFESGVVPPILGERLADVEFGDERANVSRIAEAARARGTKVVFLFLPYYTGPSAVQERRFYERYGPVLDASFVKDHHEWFSDVGHLNHQGALALTDWLAPQLAAFTKDGAPQ